MKPRKLHMDTSPQDQPEGTYPFAKNGVVSDLQNSVFNEPGFALLETTAPYKPIGILETDTYPVILSTDNTHSAIGFLDTDNDVYIPIVDDAENSDLFPIGFRTDKFITGQCQRNYKNELVIAFTDKNLFPKYVNCDNPSFSTLDDLRLFPVFRAPRIVTEVISGGLLAPGAYYVAIGYEKLDGTSTAYSEVSSVAIVGTGSIAGVSDKALHITVTNTDSSYDYLRLAIISKVDGIVKTVELLDTLPVSDQVEFTYTGSSLQTSDISVEDVLTPPVQYSKVGTIGQLNDALYLGELEIEPEILDLQKYAILIKVKWVSNLIGAISQPSNPVDARTFLHQEVYALYIRYNKVKGGKTQWFHIPGPDPSVDALSGSTEASLGGHPDSVPKYQCEDVIEDFTPGDQFGGTGPWMNQTETYPDTDDFNAAGLGGRNLRNKPVLHHRMPSLRWCKANIWSAALDYGRTTMDTLNLRLEGVVIPEKYNGILDGYELGYAKRTVSSTTIMGGCIMLHGIVNNYDLSGSSSLVNIYTSGGNWKSEIFHKGKTDYDENKELVQLRLDTFRIHAPDLILNKPSIQPTLISAQFKLRRENLKTEGYLEDGADNGDHNMPTTHLIDYTTGNDATDIAEGAFLRSIEKSFYVSVGTDVENFINMRHEGCFVGVLRGLDSSWPIENGTSSYRIRGTSFTEAEIGSAGIEEAYFITLVAVKSDIYQTFYSQSMVSAGYMRPVTDLSVFNEGDCYVNDFTFHTYGRHDSIDTQGEGFKGKKVIRRVILESSANLRLRFETPGNVYSKWWPHSPVAKDNPDECYITRFDRSVDPNQIGYSIDFNALNDLTASIIFSPYREVQLSFPHRIHRGGKLPRQGKFRNWKTFLPLDYYECQKNMGRIIHLEGMDDRLLIHHENALFKTQDKAKLEAGNLSVILGSGDIFQFEPQEANSDKLGYAGTRHELACVRTPIGYVFPDAQLGEIFIFKDKLINLNPDINTFLRTYLKITGINIFDSNGITMGWDQKYKRLLLTVKNQSYNGLPLVITNFEDTDIFWDNLEIGDFILYNNRLVQYTGENDTEFDCPTEPDIITWEPRDPACILDDDGNNTGYKLFANRAKLINGTEDSTEENLDGIGEGPYFPPVQDLLACPLIEIEVPPPPPDGYLCGDFVNGSYAGTDYHLYDDLILDHSVEGLVTINWEAYDRPNRFTVYDTDGNFITTTGWKGYAPYAGPWGFTLNTPESGALSFTTEPGTYYKIRVEAGGAGPTGISDGWALSITCT